MEWALDTGIFLWTSWGAAGLILGIPVCLVLFKIIMDTLNGTKRFEAIFKEHRLELNRQDKEIQHIRNLLGEEKEARQQAEGRSREYRNIISSYTSIISSMLNALRIMQKTRKLTNSTELDSEIDIILLNVQTDLKRHNLMQDKDDLVTHIMNK